MDAEAVLEKLSNLGISMTLIMKPEGPKLWLEPGSAVPPELLSEVKAHKPELLKILKIKGYHLKYSEPEATDHELAEIKARVNVEGYILLWSTVLQDLIAFYRGEADKSKIPPGFVPYSLRELKELFGKGSKVSKNELRLIHEAKRQGGVIKDRESHATNEI
jgi:hypothetical protein